MFLRAERVFLAMDFNHGQKTAGRINAWRTGNLNPSSLIARSRRPHSLGNVNGSGSNRVFDFQRFNMTVNKGVVKPILVGLVEQRTLIDRVTGIWILRPGVIYLV